MNIGALDNTGNQGYTYSHGRNPQDPPMNSIGLRNHTEGEAFM